MDRHENSEAKKCLGLFGIGSRVGNNEGRSYLSTWEIRALAPIPTFLA